MKLDLENFDSSVKKIDIQPFVLCRGNVVLIVVENVVYLLGKFLSSEFLTSFYYLVENK